jgi:hypothetical protein
MTHKILLAKNNADGNLKEYTQMYYVYFLPKELEGDRVKYCEKGSLEFVSVSSNGESVVKSYHMIDPSQERLLILDLIKLWCFHKRYKGELNEFTLNAFINDLLKRTKDVGTDILKGLYDGGLK